MVHPASQNSPLGTPSTRVNFTLDAARKVKSLIDEEGRPQLNLRVAVRGGGCSGLKYIFSFDEHIQPDDWVITQSTEDTSTLSHDKRKHAAEQVEVQLLIDPYSFLYLQGADIDYRQDIHGEQFIIRNPKAKATCGCGSSFATHDQDQF